MPHPDVLLIGGAGKTGSRISRLLSERGIASRSVSRSSQIPFDWTDPSGWPAALAGATRAARATHAYVSFQPDLAVPEAEDALATLGGIARQAGIEKIVLLSGRGEPGAMRAEAALRADGPTVTVLRASWFDQNFSEGHFRDLVLAGEIALPAGDVPEPFTDAEDIAEVAVALLTGDRFDGEVIEVTGPESLTFAQAAAGLSDAIGRPVIFRQISVEAFRDGLQGYLPEDMIALLIELFTTVLDGRNAEPQDGVMRVLGRPATSFEAFLERETARGTWRMAS